MDNIFSIIIKDDSKDKFKSELPSTEHKILGKPIINYITDLSNTLKLSYLDTVQKDNINSLSLDENCNVVVFRANMPLLNSNTLLNLLETHKFNDNDITILSEEDNTKFENNICVIKNSSFLKYVNDLQSILQDSLCKTQIVYASKNELMQINNRVDLYNASEILKDKINVNHMLNGVTIIDKATTYISVDTEIDIDTVIYPNVCIEGRTTIGKNTTIGSGSKIVDCNISDNVTIQSSHLIESTVGSNTGVGPFAYVRPHTIIGSNCKIGDFVELKNSTIGDKTKISHLTYVGDALVGENVNFGCGVVTVNYNSVSKSKTIIEDNCFIGCNTNLIAPVFLGANVYVAAGSTITEDVPENSLAIARSHQVNKPNWTLKKD